MELECPYCDWEGPVEQVKEFEMINELEAVCPVCKFYLREKTNLVIH